MANASDVVRSRALSDRDYIRHTSAAAELAALPSRLRTRNELLPALGAVCAAHGVRGRIGLVLLDDDRLRLAPGSFGLEPVLAATWSPAVGADAVHLARFLGAGRAETWNVLSPDAPLPGLGDTGLRRFLAVPLTLARETVGVVVLADKARVFSVADAAWLEQLAPFLATAVRTVELLFDARESSAVDQVLAAVASHDVVDAADGADGLTADGWAHVLEILDQPGPVCTTHQRSLLRRAGDVLEGVESRFARGSALRQAERDRVATELHDHALQLLFAADACLTSLVESVAPLDPPTSVRVARTRDLVVEAGASIRTVVMGRPRESEDPVRRLRTLGSELSRLFPTPVTTEVDAHAEALLTAAPPSSGDALCRAVREAVLNALKHARATAVTVQARVANIDTLTVTVTDDGIGCPSPDSRRQSFGLPSLAASMAACGGRVTLGRPDAGGTVVTLEVRL